MSKTSRAVAARYGNVARSYRRFWAPAMIALSRPLIRAMPVEGEDRIAELGTGVGAIGARLAPRARPLIGLHVSEGMPRHAPRGVLSVAGDMRRLRFADETLDAAFGSFRPQR